MKDRCRNVRRSPAAAPSSPGFPARAPARRRPLLEDLFEDFVAGAWIESGSPILRKELSIPVEWREAGRPWIDPLTEARAAADAIAALPPPSYAEASARLGFDLGMVLERIFFEEILRTSPRRTDAVG